MEFTLRGVSLYSAMASPGFHNKHCMCACSCDDIHCVWNEAFKTGRTQSRRPMCPRQNQMQRGIWPLVCLLTSQVTVSLVCFLSLLLFLPPFADLHLYNRRNHICLLVVLCPAPKVHSFEWIYKLMNNTTSFLLDLVRSLSTLRRLCCPSECLAPEVLPSAT